MREASQRGLVHSDGDDFGLLYRPIRFRSASPAGLFRVTTTEPRGALHSTGLLSNTPAHSRFSHQRPSSHVGGMQREGHMTVGVRSVSPSVLRDYTPVKLGWQPENSVDPPHDVLSAVRLSRAAEVGSVTPLTHATEPSPTVQVLDRLSRNSPQLEVRRRNNIPPAVQYALLITSTNEVEARATIDMKELCEYRRILDAFRCAVERESIRVAAFRLFRLERRARASLDTQEARERAIIDFWQRDDWRDVQMRLAIGWCHELVPRILPDTAVPSGKDRRGNAVHAVPSQITRRDSVSFSPVTPHAESPSVSNLDLSVCDEMQIGDATQLLNFYASHRSSPEPDGASCIAPPAGLTIPAPDALASPKDAFAADAVQFGDSVAAMLLREQQLNAKIARQRIDCALRVPRQPLGTERHVDADVSSTRDESYLALMRRMASLFD